MVVVFFLFILKLCSVVEHPFTCPCVCVCVVFFKSESTSCLSLLFVPHLDVLSKLIPGVQVYKKSRWFPPKMLTAHLDRLKEQSSQVARPRLELSCRRKSIKGLL